MFWIISNIKAEVLSFGTRDLLLREASQHLMTVSTRVMTIKVMVARMSRKTYAVEGAS